MSVPQEKTAVTSSISDLRWHIRDAKWRGDSIGLVPTMGALHEGHLSIVRQSIAKCDFSVVSIFVNPTQFAAGEDLERYPRDLDRDLGMLQQAGVDLIFVPDSTDIYPEDFSVTVNPPNLAQRLEGEFRPSHFGGVCTIVLKLINIVAPDFAFFGQKDYQQLCVIRSMVRDLNVAVQIEACPIVRADDGLALSSRNVFLDEEQRQTALSINRTLQLAADQISSGVTDGHEIMAAMRQNLVDAGVDSIDYAVLANPETLQVADNVIPPVVALIAATVGKTRLIDNLLID